MRRLGIILFFLALCLPVLQSATGWAPDPPLDENRVLARWPGQSPWINPIGYFAGAQDWFDDRFGFRPFLTRLKTQIDFSVFGTSTKVHVGKDGWLFYRSVLDVEKPGMERYISANKGLVTSGIENLARSLKQRNVRLILMPVLLGDVFYRNELPSSVPDLPQPGQFARAMERWRKLPDVIFIDTPSILRRVMKQRAAFHRTDFHWNDPAAFEVARVLVDTIAANEGKAPVFDHRLQIATRHYIGKESSFLPLFRQPSENTLVLVPTWSDTRVRKQLKDGVFELVTTQTKPDAKTLPGFCIVGDSFFDGIYNAGIQSYFRRTYRIRWDTPTSLDLMLQHLPADCRYLLIEFIEVQSRAIFEFAQEAQGLPLRGPTASSAEAAPQ